MYREPEAPEYQQFRQTVRAFAERECLPYHAQWEADGIVPREVWKKAGAAGILATAAPEKFGGGGQDDFRFNAIVNEELTKARVHGPGFIVHNDLVQPYLLKYCTPEQQQRWLPGFCSGETISAIAMSEPGGGSDLQAIATTAIADGDDYLVNGSKTFITNGINADLVIVVVKTDPDAGAAGTSLLVLERGMPGFERGRSLDKIGLKAQDTAELFFRDVRVPKANLLGEQNQGFAYLMQALPQERLAIAVVAVAAMERALQDTIAYCKQRKAFGRSIGSFQHNRFVLAELDTEITIARTFIDRCIELLAQDKLTIPDAAKAKWWTTELQKKVIDACVQLHGGYGLMSEYDAAQDYLNARFQTIYGGTTEIMKEIVGRALDL
ncbi:acyl-CoA dehydrogenase family protein [Nocardia sp. NPDC050175]|uniref:acyl-CoA dehydrogenase family protein n=1 Tax=Nocardia sp. NPDC050175 TaxID=3364317 RepID=UPI0037A04B28